MVPSRTRWWLRTDLTHPSGQQRGPMSEVTTPADADLLQSLRGGRADAYGELFQRHHAAARRYAVRLVRNRATADEVTSCVVGKDRITAQGDDQDGATVVASFALESKAGSLTVSSADDAWAVGPAGGTEIEGVKVSKDGISGHGPFTKRTFSEDKEGKRSGDPTDGTFELSCRASEDAGD